MSARATATLLALISFIVIVGVGLLGADRPPPPGFLFLVAMAAGFAAGVRALIPRLLQRTPGRALFLAGVCGASWSLVGWTLSLIGTPWSAWLLVGLIVVCGLGAAAAVVVMSVALLVTRPHP